MYSCKISSLTELNCTFFFLSVIIFSDGDSDSDSDDDDDEGGTGGGSNASSLSGRYKGSGGGDGNDAIRSSSKPSGSQNLLFVHQEKWQQDLLSKYGSDLTMIDATYRTTKYDIPLFFLVVPTNVGYIVVAEFCIQSEGAEDIAEALQVILCMVWCCFR